MPVTGKLPLDPGPFKCATLGPSQMLRVLFYRWRVPKLILGAATLCWGQTATIINVGSTPAGVAADPISKTAVVASAGNQSLSVIDLVTLKVTDTIANVPSPAGITYNTLGLAVVTTGGRTADIVTIVVL